MDNPQGTRTKVTQSYNGNDIALKAEELGTLATTAVDTPTAPAQASPSLGTQLAQRISPSGLGCAIVFVIVGMLIAFATRDLPRVLTSNPSAGTVPPAIATPALPHSLTLLGTSPTGIVYYFQSPIGIFTDSTRIAPLPAFEAFHWSPRRNKIAFIVQDRSDALPLLYVFDLSSNQLAQATARDPDGFPAEFGLKATSPIAWSQDEAYIAFVAYDRNGKATLFVTEVATKKVRRLTDGVEPATSVAWETYRIAPNIDDERIVYVLVRDNKELTYSVKKDGAENNPWQR